MEQNIYFFISGNNFNSKIVHNIGSDSHINEMFIQNLIC